MIQLAIIFGTFRNPDKETVLTPWRVVNLQLGKTIGGLSFFDDQFKDTTTDGVSANHWIDTEYTKQVFKRDTKILEINSKTGLYPLCAPYVENHCCKFCERLSSPVVYYIVSYRLRFNYNAKI